MLRDFGRNTVVCWISDDQVFLDRAVERVVQHCVDAANRRVAQPWLFPFLRFAKPTTLL